MLNLTQFQKHDLQEFYTFNSQLFESSSIPYLERDSGFSIRRSTGLHVLPIAVGIITKYTGGVMWGAVRGIYCGIGKVEKAWEKLKYELTPERENRLLKFKLATEKWCNTYDNQKDGVFLLDR
jgi:hypothetical protein